MTDTQGMDEEFFLTSDMKNYRKLKDDMKTIKDAINDPNKNGFDICRLIKSITDEYNFEEKENELI